MTVRGRTNRAKSRGYLAAKGRPKDRGEIQSAFHGAARMAEVKRDGWRKPKHRAGEPKR